MRLFRVATAVGLLCSMTSVGARGAEMRLQRIERHSYRLTMPETIANSWREANVGRLQVRIPAGAGLLDRERLPEGRDLDFTVAAPGCSLVQVDVGPAVGRDRPDAWQRVTRCVKFVVCADLGDAEADRRARRGAGSLLTAKTGSRIEIRPLFNPALLVAGSAFPVRLYSGGGAAAGGVVEAMGPAGERLQETADAHGIATLTLPDAGPWTLRFERGGRVAELIFDVLSR